MSDDDARFEEAIARLDRLANRVAREQTERMEPGLADVGRVVNGVPMPGTFHPFYEAERTLIAEWLNDDGHPFGDHMLITRRREPTVYVTDPSPVVDLNHDELRRRRYGAPAPYVGRPYMLVWWAATDKLGRAVAGRARARFLDLNGPDQDRFGGRI